jgi:hypothetical protein
MALLFLSENQSVATEPSENSGGVVILPKLTDDRTMLEL